MALSNPSLVYSHPYVGVYVEDNTMTTEDTTTVDTQTVNDNPFSIMQIGRFAKGRDNTLLSFDSWSACLNEFGAPNYKLYGQAGYNAYAALANNPGLCRLYAMRVMPDNATYSNIVIMASYKWGEYQTTDAEGKPATKTGMIIKFTGQTTNSLSSKESLKTYASAKYAAPGEDPATAVTSALFGFHSLGRGKYGNSIRVRFNDMTAYDNDPTTKSFKVDVLEYTTSLNVKESFTGTFNEIAFSPVTKSSLYLEDMINDPDTGSTKLGVNIVYQTFEDMINFYNENKSEDVTPITVDTADFINGLTMEGLTDYNIYIDPESTISLTAIEGFALQSGGDGDFGTLSDEALQTSIDNCLTNAFNGVYDESVLSRYGSPVDCILDANFSIAVKKAMIALGTKRQEDTMVYIDMGTEATTGDALVTFAQSLQNLGGPNILKEAHYYKLRDTIFTGKQITVTTTYNIAKLLPTHVATYGLGTPFVMQNARITDAIKGSFGPLINPNNDELKNKLYKLRVNYYENVSRNVYQRSTAITSQASITDRSDEFNEYILHLAAITCEDLLRGNLYNLAEEADRARYQSAATDVLNVKIGNLVRNMSVSYDMSALDEMNNLLRIKLQLTFRTIVKRGIVEIYINPRGSTSSTTASTQESTNSAT